MRGGREVAPQGGWEVSQVRQEHVQDGWFTASGASRASSQVVNNVRQGVVVPRSHHDLGHVGGEV